MDATAVFLIAHKEFRDLWRSRWFAVMAAAFAALSLGLSALGTAVVGLTGVAGFARTTASLLNLVMLIVPLMGLIMGAMSLAAEREHGTLLALLAQPVTAGDVLLGKWAGLAAALAAAVTGGFAVSALAIARAGGAAGLRDYLALAGLTVGLGWAHVALGLWISAGSRRSAPALGLAIFLWMVIVLVGDLGVMGTAVVLQLKPAQLLWLGFGNPAQVFRLAVLQAIHGDLEMLGAAGAYAASRLGPWLLPSLLGALAVWIAAPLGAAFALFRRRGAL
ncbi:MAG: ABC transporter permease subunit [Candidatus Omnitrophica bacterium]|nr:ABC transporter permease subunit [Candidatus Omnitrophota bacterium]